MSDALERLKNRKRPKVPGRSLSLDSNSVDTSTSSIQSNQGQGNEQTNENYDSLEVVQSNTLSKLPKSFATKQTTIRLESKIMERLTKLCTRHGLSREVLLEALFEHYETDDDALSFIIEQAKAKADLRQAIANRKRAKTMMDKFG
jgi:hypothetical protein